MFGVYFRVFASVTKAFGSVCRSLKRNILIFFGLTKFLKSVLSIEIWPKRLFENLRKLPKNGHFWPTTCNSDNPKFMRINSKFVIFRTTKVFRVWWLRIQRGNYMFAKKKVLNQQTDYRNKNLKYRSTNDVNYHVSRSCDNLNLLVFITDVSS